MILSRKQVFALGLCFFLFVAYCIWRIAFPETPKQAAERLLNCLELGDTGCVWPYVHEQERQRLGLDRRSLGALLDVTGAKTAREGKRLGKTQFMAAEGSGYIYASRRYSSGSAIPGIISIKVHVTDSGLTCSPIVWELVYCRLGTMMLQEPEASQERKATRIAVQLAKLAPALESTGIRGCLTKSAFGEYYTWAQLEDTLRTNGAAAN